MASLSRGAKATAVRIVKRDPLIALRIALAVAEHREQVAELIRLRRRVLSTRAQWNDVRVQREMNAARAAAIEAVARTQTLGLSRALTDTRLAETLSESIGHLTNAVEAITGDERRQRRRTRRRAIGAAAALVAASLAVWGAGRTRS